MFVLCSSSNMKTTFSMAAMDIDNIDDINSEDRLGIKDLNFHGIEDCLGNPFKAVYSKASI